MSWILKMAWRDTRTSRRRLLLYAVSISLGIGAMVAIASLGESLRQAVRQQSTALLGADLILRSNAPLGAEVEAAVATLGGERAREIGFSSMVLFPASGQSRLVSVRAIEDGFPFYGAIETRPVEAATTFRGRRAVLVEENLMLQFGARVGDELRLGTQTFEIAGALIKVPGESPGFNLVAPRVYLPMQYLEQTQLVQRGSRLQYRLALKVPPSVDVDAFRRAHDARFDEERVRLETVNGREAALGRTIANLERFLGLVAFVALLLGAVGVASGVHVFVRQKLASIAVLRCVGATSRQTFLIYLVQAAGLGLVGALAGVALGLGVQAALPRFLGGLLPTDLELVVSGRAVAEGLAAGVGVTLALTLLPLLAVRRVSPLLAIRSTVEPPRGSWRDPATLAVLALGLGAVTLVAVNQAARVRQGVGFVVGAIVIFGVLALIGRALMALARRLAPRRAGYVWRQGVANLFRPNNRTLLLIVALGLGTCLVATMLLTQRLLIGQLELSQAEGQSNMILFDIQTDQRASVRAAIEGQGRRVIDEAPVVSMRLASIKGRSVADILDDRSARRPPRWVLQREYRSTFRRALNDAERLAAGVVMPEVAAGVSPVPVSIEVDIARDLGVTIGDLLVFDVQGVPVDCVVGSLREVETRRVRPFFFVVFPEGVLEGAPQFFIMSTHVPDAAASGSLQRELFEKFPNVSAIDLTLILETVNAVIDKAGFIFRFMAAFIVGTGVVVLFGVMASGRLQRLRESVLLRTIGASRRQITWIQGIEYWMLGSIAALTGAVLAWFAAWGLGHWIFELRSLPEVGPLVVLWLGVSGLTVLVGALSGRRLLNQPPLELLRQET
ncbi:MAG: ABC transporter permease [Opitutaceae bacterium]|nr:ABC transporter permease [Opitutaceae bacterium]